MRDTILILGSGATKGSGLTAVGGTRLPVDSEFLAAGFRPLQLLKDDQGYPALRAAFDILPALQATGSLYETWSILFLERSFSSSIWRDEDTARIQEELGKLRKQSSSFGRYEGQRRHYEIQFKIFDSLYPDEVPRSKLFGLAIWDLRVLVQEIYSNVSGEATGYSSFLKQVKGRLSAVANLNYDTTFEQFLRKEKFEIWCPSPQEPEQPNGTLPVVRPHGSLEWTTSNCWLLRRGWFGTWFSYPAPTALEELGYRSPLNTQSIPGLFEFRQSLIVPPDDYKETVVGNSTILGLTDELLKPQWRELWRQADGCAEWIIVGLSLQSGDKHLAYGLRKAIQSRRRTVHFTFLKDEGEGAIRGALKQHLGLKDEQLCPHAVSDSLESFNLCEGLKSGQG